MVSFNRLPPEPQQREEPSELRVERPKQEHMPISMLVVFSLITLALVAFVSVPIMAHWYQVVVDFWW